jgi:hypothetical protein
MEHPLKRPLSYLRLELQQLFQDFSAPLSTLSLALLLFFVYLRNVGSKL